MIDSKRRLILEPRAVETSSLYDWLKKYQSTLDGSPAYEDLIEVYEALDFYLSNQER